MERKQKDGEAHLSFFDGNYASMFARVGPMSPGRDSVTVRLVEHYELILRKGGEAKRLV